MKCRVAHGSNASGESETTGMLIVYHPRSPDASLERLRALSGIIRLTGPVPSWRFLGEDEPEARSGRGRR